MIGALATSIPSPDQSVWHLGPLPLRAYALCILVGIFVAMWVGDRRWVARGGNKGLVYDVAVWAVPFGIIGGRLYHVLTDWPTYFGAGGSGLRGAIAIWEGGLGIWGAIALGTVGAWIGCRRQGVPLPPFTDALAVGVPLAQAIGRLGNWFNQELFGKPTDLPWGLEIDPVHRPDGLRAVRDVPPDLPLRGALAGRGGRARGVGRPALDARARARVRPLRRRLLRRAPGHGDAAHRPGHAGRRHPDQRVHLDRRRRSGRSSTSSSVPARGPDARPRRSSRASAAGQERVPSSE